ncbi:MAG TPA: HAD family hydrolase [Acidimicrobiia bacterium]|nr:HAD family hydrolase [Acidimicrobiia bacterium]
MNDRRLPSWRPGATRDALVGFLDAAAALPDEQKVAYVDNDGTMWCEKPTYVQFDFFVEALKGAVAADASVGDRDEFAALISGDQERLGEIGLLRIAAALATLFEGKTPDQFTEAVRAFIASAHHVGLDRPTRTVVYQPMLELLDELRRIGFTVGIITGGGTEFVRALAPDLYDVAAELVVGSQIRYEFKRDDRGRPYLSRTADLSGEVNEGAPKVEHIQAMIGRQPILAVGNSAGDKEMLEWALAGDGPRLAMLINHDDADREYAYESKAGSFTEEEPILEMANRLGWLTVSIKNDWETVFSD